MKTWPFYLLVILSIVLEGLGIKNGRETAFFIILTTPFIIFLTNKDKVIKAPKSLFLISCLFIVTSALSLIFSDNVQRSFEYLLLYTSALLILLYAFNNKASIKRHLLLILLGLGFLFSLYSTLIQEFAFRNLTLLIPTSGFQFVFSKAFSHNHLGDFLVLPLTVLFYFLLKKKKILLTLLCILVFLIFIAFSYSRSAYIDLAIIGLITPVFLLGKKPIKIFSSRSIMVIFISVICLLLFLTVVSDVRQLNVFANLRGILSGKNTLQEKYLLGERNEYTYQSIQSIITNPIFGVGPGNFSYASMKFTRKPLFWTVTSHNIFLDVLVENGGFAGISFLIIIALILKNSQKNLYFLIFLAMLLNFQTDYTYRIYSFFMLFFVLAGTVYKEKKTIELKKPLLIISFFVFLFASAIFLSNVANKSSKQIFAFYLYPLNKDVYKPLIEYSFLKKDREEENFLLALYSNFFRGDPEVLSYLGGVYEKRGDKTIALKYYERALSARPFGDFSMVEKIYHFKTELEGKARAQKFIDDFFRKVEGIKEKWSIPQDARIETMKLCQKLYNLHCPYDL